VLRSPAAICTLSFVVQSPLVFATNVSSSRGRCRAGCTRNPVSLLATAVRHLMHGTASGAEVGWVLIASAAISAVFAPVTMRLYPAA
jgi:ABC-2 type transport system permease protein